MSELADQLREYADRATGYIYAGEVATLRAAANEIEGLRRALLAHHDMATLSDEVLREYDFRECPVCRRARCLARQDSDAQ